jgi:hypothetical protein
LMPFLGPFAGFIEKPMRATTTPPLSMLRLENALRFAVSSFVHSLEPKGLRRRIGYIADGAG